MYKSLLRSAAIVAVLAILAAYATIMLRGPQGLHALAEKRREVRALEDENATLARDIEQKKARIDRLKHDAGTQELEVRKRLKMQRAGDTRFILSEQSKIPPTGTPNESTPAASN